jgi:hypothetical protein
VARARFRWRSAAARAVIGMCGGFALALSFVAGTGGALATLGVMTRAEATVAAGMLAFLLWAGAVLVAFASANAVRAAAWVLGPSAGFALLGWACIARTGSLA